MDWEDASEDTGPKTSGKWAQARRSGLTPAVSEEEENYTSKPWGKEVSCRLNRAHIKYTGILKMRWGYVPQVHGLLFERAPLC